MILLSELSRRRIRSIQKLIRVGRNEIVVVLRVDKEKGEYVLIGGFLATTNMYTWQGISICQSEECLQKILLNVKKNSIRVKWLPQSCAMLQIRQGRQWRRFTSILVGH